MSLPLLTRGVRGFRVPTDCELSSGVHISPDPYQWQIVSHEEGFNYKIREVAHGGLITAPEFAELSIHQHWIVDRAAADIYGRKLRTSLKRQGVDFSWHVVDGGEPVKTLAQVEDLAKCLVASGVHRRDLLVGMGGGAVLDVARLLASLYFKGLPLGLAPTTPLAYVDAAVGVKTALNLLPDSKNLLGDYYQAELVTLDLMPMSSVNEEYTAAGLMEIAKMALIMGEDLWEAYERHARLLLESRFQATEAIEITRRAITGMVQRLQPNLREWALARDVDLGHFLVSTLELLAKRPHGIAVGIDLALMVALSTVLGYMSHENRDRVLDSIRSAGAPIYDPLLTVDLARGAAAKTRRNRGGALNLPIPVDIGRVVVHAEVDDRAIAEAVIQLEKVATG